MNKKSVENVEKILENDENKRIEEEKKKERRKLILTGKNDKVIIILFGIGLLLFTLGLSLNLILNNNKKNLNTKSEEKVDNKVKFNVEKFSTSDSSFKILSSEIEYDKKADSSNVTITYTSEKSYEELPVIISFEPLDIKMAYPAIFKNIEAGKMYSFSFDYVNNLTGVKKCNIKFTTKEVLVNKYEYIL